MHTMYAVRARARGGPEQLAYEEAPRPEPHVGEALIRIHAAGITPTELGWDETWVDRAGHPRVPTIPSHEVAGVVEAVGHCVVHVSVGDAVHGLIEFDHDGAAAEYVALRARDLARQPVSAGHVKAAAMPLSGLTAWQALVEQRASRPAARPRPRWRGRRRIVRRPARTYAWGGGLCDGGDPRRRLRAEPRRADRH